MNRDIKIISTGTALPHYYYTNSEVTEKAMEWVKDQPEKLQKLTKKIFESSNIKERHFISPLDTVLNPTSLTDSNERYVDAAKVLSQKALEQALVKANIDAVDIDDDALDVARLNIKNHELNDRIQLYKSDLFEQLNSKKYDLIIILSGERTRQG